MKNMPIMFVLPRLHLDEDEERIIEIEVKEHKSNMRTPDAINNTDYVIAEKEVPWTEQQKRLKEIMPW